MTATDAIPYLSPAPCLPPSRNLHPNAIKPQHSGPDHLCERTAPAGSARWLAGTRRRRTRRPRSPALPTGAPPGPATCAPASRSGTPPGTPVPRASTAAAPASHGCLLGAVLCSKSKSADCAQRVEPYVDSWRKEPKSIKWPEGGSIRSECFPTSAESTLAKDSQVTLCKIGLSPWLRRRLFSYFSRRGISKIDSSRSRPGGPDARKACTRLHGHDSSLRAAS